MKRYSGLAGLALLLAASPTVASEPLLELIPEDAVVALYVERPQRALPPGLILPLLEAGLGDKAAAAQVAEAVKRIPGAFVIGLLPPPSRDSDDVTTFIALELSGPKVDLDDLVEKTFFPAMEKLLEAPPGHHLKHGSGSAAAGAASQPAGAERPAGKSIRQVQKHPSGRTVFTWTVKDRIAFGSTRLQLASRWAAGDWPEKRWLNLPGVRKLLRGLPKEPTLRVLVNPLPLLRELEKPKPNSLEEVALKFLVPEDAQAGAVDLAWDESALTLRLTVALAEPCGGVARVLARPANTSRALGLFPEDFVGIGRVGYGTASDIVEGLYALTDQFDPSISAEYREEIAEFRKETGVNWDTGILGNLVEEAAFGVRVDFTRQPPIGWAVVLPLGDEAAFRTEFDKLVDHFGLPVSDAVSEGLPVKKAAVGNGVEAFLVVHAGALILAGDKDTIVEIARRAAKGADGVPASENLRACHAALGENNQLAVMLDIDRLCEKAPIVPIAAGPVLGPLLRQGSVGLVATVKEGVAHAELRWAMRSMSRKRDQMAAGAAAAAVTSPPSGDQAVAVLTQALSASLVEARGQAKRLVSAANMRGIAQGLHIYATDHKQKFPESLTELLRATDAVNLQTMVSPYTGEGPSSINEVEDKAYLIYRPGLSTSHPPREIVLAERQTDGEGANFAFVDGHVEWIRDPIASELIGKIERGETTVRYPE